MHYWRDPKKYYIIFEGSLSSTCSDMKIVAGTTGVPEEPSGLK